MAQFVLTASQALAYNAASTAAGAAAAYAAAQAATAAQNALLGPVTREGETARLDGLRLMGAEESAPIPQVYGRARLAGQLIWAGPFEEETRVAETSTGGKGVSRSSAQRVTEYLYSVSLAVALCEGPVDRIGRVWADGEPLALRDLQVRLHHGTEDQLPDPLLEAVLGEEAPAYRGLAYLVFEALPLARFGNRIPQLTFEVERSLRHEDEGALENAARAVTLIPASGEAAYATTPVLAELAEGVTRPENVYSNMGGTDITASLDHLQAALPNTEAVELIVSWFGTDLRAGECLVRPGVEERDKTQIPEDWSVAGEDRASAYLVSRQNGAPAYGGTPSDRSVREAIEDIASRGMACVFYPFLLMDIQEGNGLPDPYGGPAQGAHPWRGRITAAAGTDGTADARAQVGRFFDRYDVMIMHYAALCAQTGGVGAFLIGSELRGLTRIRDDQGLFPGVERLMSLAGRVKSVLGPEVLVSYAADWSEYAHYQPGDGSLLYPLDALWADEAVSFIGIDNYMPLSDWRDGTGHLDRLAGAASIYDPDYLRANVAGGEGYDWFYASEADRLAQLRTPIADGAHGEDWVFRYKDLLSWWSEQHHERPGGVRSAVPTPWVPRSKPFWFTELGCSATDKGANQPNVFVDPKSSENAFPYFSNRDRDDLMQRRFLEAQLAFWQDETNNPVSPVYAGPMVEPSRIFLYTWDARPFPDFPVRTGVWADAQNWTYGHWLNGRAGKVPLGALIQDVCRKAGLYAVDASAVAALVTGYVLPGPSPARDALAPLMRLYQLSAVERDGRLVVTPRDGRVTAVIAAEDLAEGEGPLLALSRAQAEDLPAMLSFAYTDGLSDYRAAVSSVTLPSGTAGRRESLRAGLVIEEGEAEGRAAALLAEARAADAGLRFALPPGALAIEPGDVAELEGAGRVLITEITDGPWREVEGVRIDEGLFSPRFTGLSGRADPLPASPGPVIAEIMDLPLPGLGPETLTLHAASFASPWPGAVAVLAGEGPDAPRAVTMPGPAVMGRLVEPLPPGPLWRWDEASRLVVGLSAGGLPALSEEAALAGRGRLAVQALTGQWEIVDYRAAILREDGNIVLTGLLRGGRGTEAEALAGAAAGARMVALSGAEPFSMPADALGVEASWQAGPAGSWPGAFPWQPFAFRFDGISARPFAPVHLSARPQPDGRLALSWTRRTRIGGDSWAGEVPLGETEERYLIRLFGPHGLLSEMQAATSEALIDPAGVTEITVAQLSSLVGAGREAILPL